MVARSTGIRHDHAARQISMNLAAPCTGRRGEEGATPRGCPVPSTSHPPHHASTVVIRFPPPHCPGGATPGAGVDAGRDVNGTITDTPLLTGSDLPGPTITGVAASGDRVEVDPDQAGENLSGTKSSRSHCSPHGPHAAAQQISQFPGRYPSPRLVASIEPDVVLFVARIEVEPGVHRHLRACGCSTWRGL